MAKTNWIDGTHLTPAQMILFFGNNAGSGHDHDGTDDDGHCPKITLSGMVSDYATGSFGADVSSTYFTTPATNQTVYYTKIGNIIVLFFPSIWGSHATNAYLELSPNGGNWPSAIIPSTAKVIGGMMFGKDDASTELRPGAIEIPNSTSSNMKCYIVDDTAEYLLGAFGSGGTSNKGIQQGCIAYTLD